MTSKQQWKHMTSVSAVFIIITTLTKLVHISNSSTEDQNLRAYLCALIANSKLEPPPKDEVQPIIKPSPSFLLKLTCKIFRFIERCRKLNRSLKASSQNLILETLTLDEIIFQEIVDILIPEKAKRPNFQRLKKYAATFVIRELDHDGETLYKEKFVPKTEEELQEMIEKLVDSNEKDPAKFSSPEQNQSPVIPPSAVKTTQNVVKLRKQFLQSSRDDDSRSSVKDPNPVDDAIEFLPIIANIWYTYNNDARIIIQDYFTSLESPIVQELIYVEPQSEEKEEEGERLVIFRRKKLTSREFHNRFPAFLDNNVDTRRPRSRD